MIHGYHVIWGAYGFWLPNDPRGSWSDFVYAWELVRFGPATKSLERVDVDPANLAAWQSTARQSLRYPAVTLTEAQINAVAEGFGRFVSKSRLAVWACSILPQHVHMVLGRHRYRIESAVNLLKGEATRRLLECDLHPMAQFRNKAKRLPSMWAENQWKVYLETESAIENAIRYVEQNPKREGRPAQRWPFVIPFTGLDRDGWVSYLA